MIKVVFWDFDGVILDSMPVRDIGFRKIFEQYPNDLVEQLIIYHRSNGGLSRFHKIKYFYNQILNKEISEDKIQQYADQFTLIMKEELTKKEYLVDQTIDFIKQNYQNAIFHIVSGSEQTELRYLCEQHGLSQYFKSIEGSPTPKNDLVKNILQREQYDPKTAILIGDSMNDHEAATINGIKFYGFNNSELIKFDYIDSFNNIKIKDLSC